MSESNELVELYLSLQRCEKRLAKFQQLAAPQAFIHKERERIQNTRQELRRLGWKGEPIPIRRTPYDLDNYTPTSADRAKKRALVLTLIAERAFLASDGDQDHQRLMQTQEWAQSLKEAFEPHEWKMIETGPGMMSKDDIFEASWNIEGAGLLCWALRLLPLPTFEEAFRPIEVKTCLGPLPPDTFRESSPPSLLPVETIQAEYEHYFALHWRLRDFRLHPEPKAFIAMGDRRVFWFGPLATDGLPDVDGDLAIGGSAIAQADPALRDRCESIIAERHRALSWLCGLADRYSEAPTDT